MTALRALLPRLGRARVAMPGITAIGVKELRGRMRGRRAFVSVTEAPGRTAPDASMIVPPIEPTPCAQTDGTEPLNAATTRTPRSRNRVGIIVTPPGS